jgi:ankyrin repeat protein
MIGIRVIITLLMLAVLTLGCMNAKLPEATDPAGSGGSVILIAITQGDAEEVGKLLDAQPDLIYEVDGGSQTPLHIAASKGNAEIVKLLLDRGADPYAMDDEGRTPAETAQSAGASQPVIDLLETSQ